MLWLALHLPQLSLEAFAATLGGEAGAVPLALLERQRIATPDARAAAMGVRPGLRRATALALAPGLRLGEADARRDAAALQAVAHAALAFTPTVVLDTAPHTVLLELASVLRCHGGAARLQARLTEALAPLGHRLQQAAAPTPAAAALLARWGAHVRLDALADGAGTGDLARLRAVLDPLPLQLLGAGAEHRQTLQDMGLRCVADLRALPRAGLARRFGPALLDEIDRARGDAPDPRQPLVLAPVFDDGLELHARADTAEQLLHGAAVLLARLIAWAQARQARIAAFSLLLQHERTRRQAEQSAGEAAQGLAEGSGHTMLKIELAEPGADARQLQLLLRERLARCGLPAPVHALRLRCRRWVQAAAPSGELFASPGSRHEGWLRLLERLRARLGDAQVQPLQPLPDHRPERAAGMAALPPQGAAGSLSALRPGKSPATLPARAEPAHPMPPARAPHPALPLSRPAWLLARPQALAERAALPLLDGRPLQLLAGPERIEAGWWDAELAARDYFIARTEAGALVWLYRTRLAQPGGWFLQGRFA